MALTLLTIVIAANLQDYPDVAYEPASDQYLVVWEDDRTAPTKMYGQRINDDGTLAGNNVRLDNATSAISYPAVAATNGITATVNLFGLDLIHQDDGTQTRTLLTDGLGSARVEMVGSAVETVSTYEPYGKLLSQTGNSGTVYGFTGEQEDGAAGLVYLRGRYYNPYLNQFQSKDPFAGYVGLSQSQNGYNYVHNNPINLADPTGHDPFRCSFINYLLHPVICGDAATIPQIGVGFVSGYLEDNYGYSGPSDFNKNVNGSILITSFRQDIINAANATGNPMISPGLLGAIVRTQGGPNFPLLGELEVLQVYSGACSVGITQMDVGNAMRLQELGLMPSLGGEQETGLAIATSPALSLQYMATMLNYADNLFMSCWGGFGQGEISTNDRLMMLAVLQNGSLRSVEAQIESMQNGTLNYDVFVSNLQKDLDVDKVIPWIDWAEQILE